MSHLLVSLVDRLCNASGLQSVLSLMHQGSIQQVVDNEGMASPYFEDEDVSQIKEMRIVPWKN